MSWKNYSFTQKTLSLCVVFQGVAFIWFISNNPPMTAEEKTRQALECQANFTANAWFDSVEGKSGNPWTVTVLEQREFVNGIYQTKVLRDEDSHVFLTLSGRELSPGNKVRVRMYEYRSSQIAFTSFIHVVEE